MGSTGRAGKVQGHETTHEGTRCVFFFLAWPKSKKKQEFRRKKEIQCPSAASGGPDVECWDALPDVEKKKKKETR